MTPALNELENLMNNDRKTLRLATLISGGLAVWAVAFFVVHGPVIVAYLALQVLTSGVFVWEMRRIEQKSVQSKLATAVGTEARDDEAKDKAA